MILLSYFNDEKCIYTILKGEESGLIDKEMLAHLLILLKTNNHPNPPPPNPPSGQVRGSYSGG